jgi:hypothetical protein
VYGIFFLLVILNINIISFYRCFRTGYCKAYKTQVFKE